MKVHSVTLQLFVDDASIKYRGDTPAAIAQGLLDACNELRYQFEVKLGMPFAPDKAFIISSNSATVTAAKALFGVEDGEIVSAGRRIGVDHYLNHKSGAGVFGAMRFAKAKARKARIKAMHVGNGHRNPRVFRCGIISFRSLRRIGTRDRP